MQLPNLWRKATPDISSVCDSRTGKDMPSPLRPVEIARSCSIRTTENTEPRPTKCMDSSGHWQRTIVHRIWISLLSTCTGSNNSCATAAVLASSRNPIGVEYASQCAIRPPWYLAVMHQASADSVSSPLWMARAGTEVASLFGQGFEVFKWKSWGGQAADLIAGSVAKYASSGVWSARLEWGRRWLYQVR